MEKTAELRLYDSLRKRNEHELSSEDGMNVSFSANRNSMDFESESIDTAESSLSSTFLSNYECWLNDANVFSASNYDNANFNRIVELGESVIPAIYDIISKEANPVVHALDRILPGVVEYNGYVSLQEACQAWTTILPILGKV